MGHLAAELFQSEASLKMTHVPYKGGAPAIMGLLGGQVDVYFSTPAAAIAQVKSGKLRALAVTSAKRADFAAELPTVSESGLKGYEVSGWYGLFAPAGTPPAALDAMNRAIATAVNDPELRKSMANEGNSVVGNAPAEFAKEVRSDFVKWRKVIESSQIELE
jgi:tripartite-type tricarboxylate transporter receptor subunit TctC